MITLTVKQLYGLYPHIAALFYKECGDIATLTKVWQNYDLIESQLSKHEKDRYSIVLKYASKNQNGNPIMSDNGPLLTDEVRKEYDLEMEALMNAEVNIPNLRMLTCTDISNLSISANDLKGIHLLCDLR